MPTYDYRCDACAHTFEEYQSFSDELLKKCPKCGKKKLVRLFGTGSGVIFKGSGFYETDYRSDSYKQAAKADQEKPAAAKEDGKGVKSESGDKSGKSDSGDKGGKNDSAGKSAANGPATDSTGSARGKSGGKSSKSTS